MSSPGSVTHWIAALKDGDSAAAEPLWKRYYGQLIALARYRLRFSRSRETDEEDVVQNVFQCFFRSIADGRFPELGDRDSLWRLLVCITAKKSMKQLAHEQRLKRGGGTVIEPMGIDFIEPDDDSALAQFMSLEPTPDFAVQVADECRRLLTLLGDESLRRVAVWKMEGYTNDEIAENLACSRRTVARKLDAIRIFWSKEHLP
jgi:DNA-directed RNA polymerase specialized sigma24 family protein